ncbi:MAG: hypothetical protein V7646_1806 [Pseudonocardia sp.]
MKESGHLRFRQLVMESPALREYAGRMWARHERALAEAIATDRGEDRPSPQVRALAHIVYEIPSLMQGPGDDPTALREAVFGVREPKRDNLSFRGCSRADQPWPARRDPRVSATASTRSSRARATLDRMVPTGQPQISAASA